MALGRTRGKVWKKCIPGRVKSSYNSPAEGKSLVGLRTRENISMAGGKQRWRRTVENEMVEQAGAYP